MVATVRITALGGTLDADALRGLASIVRTSRALAWSIAETLAHWRSPSVARVATALGRSEAEVGQLARLVGADAGADPSAALALHDASRRLRRAGAAIGDVAYVVLGDVDASSPTDARLERVAETFRVALREAPEPERLATLAQLLGTSLGAAPAFWERLAEAHPALLAPLLSPAFLEGAAATDALRVLSRAERAATALGASPEASRTALTVSAPEAFEELAPVAESDLTERLGVDEATLRGWASEPTQALADELEAVVRERAGERWPEVGKRLRDPIRERQVAALSAYLLGAGRPPGATWRNTSDLYAHFLVDPEMSACARTSRIKLAHLSVQLFVQRVLMRLEPGAVADAEADPGWRQWAWRRSYRVWEAGRRVLLYPENLLAPELRRDKTPLFAQLESVLAQDEVTEARAEDALVGYLEGLGQIAHLEAVGFTVEERAGRETVHVFGRTRGEPTTYHYRRLEKTPHGARWTPWEEVGVAIDEGASLLPLMWHGQLYLFWPQLTEKTEAPPMDTVPEGGQPLASGREYTELRLAWSRYRDGQWTGKQLSPPAGPLPARSAFVPRLAERHWNDDRGLSVLCALDPVGVVAQSPGSETRWEAAFAFDHPAARPRVFFQGLARALPDPDWRSLGAAVDAADGELRLAPLATRAAMTAHSLRLLPPSLGAFEAPHEVVVEDATRSFYVDWDASEELLALLREAARSGNPWLTILIGIGAAGSVRYRAQLFHAPFVDRLLAAASAEGAPGLYQRAVQLAPWVPGEAPTPLEDAYAMDDGVFAEPYPRDDLDFGAAGAYATYLWELFVHAPLLIAEQLRQSQRFEEARRWLHFVFDPTNASDAPAPERYWIARPLFEAASQTGPARIESLLDPARRADDALLHQVEVWADDPFDAHAIARLRPLAMMKHVFMRYLDLLIEEADHRFGGATDWEDLNAATQLYVRAADLLGPAPERLPARERGEPQSYDALRERLDPLGNAAVAYAENLIGRARPTRAGVLAELAGGAHRAGVPNVRLSFVPYFCFPPNARLLAYWDTLADRLFKLRHCQDIEGGALSLPLFEPPIDPGVLARARELGVDVRDALRDVDAVSPYRFEALLGFARQLTQDVRSLGAALSSALERRDAEALALLRASHEVELLERAKADRERQVEDAVRARAALVRSVELTTLRRDYYASREYLNAGEAAQLALLTQTIVTEHAAGALDLVGNVIQLIPDFKVGSPFSIGATFGGSNLGPALRAFAAFTRSQGAALSTQASMSGMLANYQRRAEDWALSRDLADKELARLAEQAASAELREAMARSERSLHERRIEQAAETHALLRDRFSNEDLYSWMSGQLGATYFAAYQLAHQAARRAERAMARELGEPTASFVRPGAWDSLREGLLAGEQLALDLSRMEASYRERHAREHELTKNVSLRDLDPLALLSLREGGASFFELPEALFDRDFPAHVLRRIKSVAVSIPAVTGPLGGVPCTLSLVSSRVRRAPGGPLEPLEAAVRQVALSTGQRDAGLFEPRLEDPRYLPFEGAGAVSQWRLELAEDAPFDYRTISDVVLHLRYTAQDGDAARPVEPAPAPRDEENRAVLMSAKRELPDAWARLVDEGAPLAIEIGPDRFPFRVASSAARIERVEVLAAFAGSLTPVSVRLTDPDGATHEGPLATHADVESMAHTAFDVAPRALADEQRAWALELTEGDAAALDDVYLLVRYTTG